VATPMCATPTCATQPPATESTAADVLRSRCDTYIAGELARLARRSPALGDNELRLVSISLRRVVECLLLERVRGRPSDHLIALFDLEEAT
jgi:hypothetical protein